jgi:predicted nucleic acid-binding protein
MRIIVDTCIWSLALRRRNNLHDPAVSVLEELIKESRVQMMGPIRQELLSGIRSESQFNRLSEILRAFPDLQLQSSDYESAARFFNLCRGKGIQGSNSDFLICAVSKRKGLQIFTNDKDFEQYENLLKIELFKC